MIVKNPVFFSVMTTPSILLKTVYFCSADLVQFSTSHSTFETRATVSEVNYKYSSPFARAVFQGPLMLTVIHVSVFIITVCAINYAQLIVFRSSLVVERSKLGFLGQTMDTASLLPTDLQQSTVTVD